MKYTPEEYAEKAGELFHEGYNCAQAVVAVFADEVGLDMDTAMKFGASFGGGLGKMREVCGAVSGMAMVAGMKYGAYEIGDNARKKEHYALIRGTRRSVQDNQRVDHLPRAAAPGQRRDRSDGGDPRNGAV